MRSLLMFCRFCPIGVLVELSRGASDDSKLVGREVLLITVDAGGNVGEPLGGTLGASDGLQLGAELEVGASVGELLGLLVARLSIQAHGAKKKKEWAQVFVNKLVNIW
jgi:hypothetical protein